MLLHVYLITKPFCWSKDETTQTSGVSEQTTGKKMHPTYSKLKLQ